MMDLSLLSVAGTVVANAARTNAYVIANRALFERCDIEVVECDCCDLGDGPYVDPETDGAPWWSGTDPASAEFLGVILTGSSLHAMNASRQVTDNPVRGGTAGRQHENALQAVFRGRLYATTARGMDYGRRWLAQTFRNLDCGPCDDSIAGQPEVRYLAYCDADGTAPGCEGERAIVGAKLTAGPTYTGISGDDIDGDPCSRHAQDVTFTFASPSPFVFGPDDCEPVCLDEADLYAGDAGSSWGAGAAVWATRELGVTVISDAKVTAAAIWGKPAADYFDGTGDTGGDIEAGGTWTDPDHLTRRSVVIAYQLDQPAGPPVYTRIRKITVAVEVEYVSRSRDWSWDLAMTVVDGDGVRIAGWPQGNITGLPYDVSGSWKGTPGTPQRFAFTIENPDGWTVAEVDAFRFSYVARSRTVATVPDELEVTAVEAFAYGYSGDGEPCACSWCRDFCRHEYQCCTAIPPAGADAAPVVTVEAPDGADVHVEIIQGLETTGGGGGGPVEPGTITDSFNRADSGSPGSTNGGTFGPVAWQVLTGAAGIDGNQLVLSDEEQVIVRLNPGVVASTGHVAVTPTLLAAPPEGGYVYALLAAHFDIAAGNGLFLVLQQESDLDWTLSLSQLVGGVPTDLWSGVAANGDTLAMHYDADEVEVRVNGAPVTTETFDASLAAVAGYGLFAKIDGNVGGIDIAAFEDFAASWGAGEGGGSELEVVGCDPDDDEWRCADDPCARLNVRGTGTLVMDGRLRMGDPRDAVAGDGNSPFRWPDACCGPLCICVAARGVDGEPAASTVTVRWVRRYLV